MKRRTPSKAVKDHCRIFCMNGHVSLIKDCAKISNCVLAKKIPALKKIKAFCKECAPDFNLHECCGEVLNTPETINYGKCPLWIYRFGHNPKRKGIGNKGGTPENFRKKHELTTSFVTQNCKSEE